MNSTIEKLRVVTCVSQKSLEVLKNFLTENGFRLFELNGENIRDKASFFVEAGEQLPHEPGLIARTSWDAFLDTLRGGLAVLEDGKVAIVWTHVENILASGLADLLVAVDCFQDAASDLAITEPGFPRPMLLRVFLVGEGNNFPVFSG